MRIIFFTKRQYMQKDVIDDRYARLYELPNQLANQGNEVLGICLSYRKRDEGVIKHFQKGNSGLSWHSYNLGSFIIPGLVSYIYCVFSFLRSFKPDVIIGSSDCPIVILTAIFSSSLNIPYFVDLYDNYESFGLAKIPGILLLYRWAIKRSAGVSCVSEPLSEYIRQRYGHTNVVTLESTIIGGDFYHQDKQVARTAAGLPSLGKIIGVAGSLNRNRGINLLYDSFIQLSERMPDLHLALAGPIDSASPIPKHPHIHYLGLLPHGDIVSFYNALDLAVVCMRDTEFGRYAFPQKTYEILACTTPIVTAKLGALKQTFKDYPQCLYEPDNQNDLQARIENLLKNPVSINIPIPTWQDQAKKLLAWMQESLPSIVKQ
jgi:teichuronic acid biosynthesis glycosyltransferase TuaC